MSLYYLTNDLMFSSRVAGVAQQLGLQLRMIGSLANLLDEAKTAGCSFVLIDLTLPGLNPAAAVEQIKAAFPNAELVAYGPHVHEARLQSAAAAGCNEVLTRGQFHQNMEQVLGRVQSAECRVRSEE